MTRPKMVSKVAWWLTEDQYDWVDSRWAARFSSRQIDLVTEKIQRRFIEQPALWVLCKLFGHAPIMDHCGMPKHDHCAYCWKQLPNQAPRSGAQTRYWQEPGREWGHE